MSPSGDLSRHQALDERLRAAMNRDRRITHALAYGSFTQGTADGFSDLEYWLYLSPGSVQSFDLRAWLDVMTPLTHCVVNEFGTFVGVLPGLLRVELHAVSNTELAALATWPGDHAEPARMLVKDTDGALRPLLDALAARRSDPAAEAQAVLDRLLNWLAFGLNVLSRGERVRAHELLWWVQSGLLMLARLRSGRTQHWLNATRRAELELDAASLERYAAITGGLADLERCYAGAARWTLELAEGLGLRVNAGLAQDLRSVLEA
ncbi:hypothetical protein [Deinococcus koreensis]|uniref:Lincosamide nucleotidyltransferase-like C-terminal domain-containing protein n=1 Tax=Deinococcus koreensis TaxID=2054903 RepID=A0A2K3UYE8_9DEIO|nr:hypothetical protein [Deinococcus koreensis]PNY81551.1 hypothetical protein CVO96_09320 [Deinococcus koreensis]